MVDYSHNGMNESGPALGPALCVLNVRFSLVSCTSVRNRLSLIDGSCHTVFQSKNSVSPTGHNGAVRNL